jgi:hypothetical protein
MSNAKLEHSCDLNSTGGGKNNAMSVKYLASQIEEHVRNPNTRKVINQKWVQEYANTELCAIVTMSMAHRAIKMAKEAVAGDDEDSYQRLGSLLQTLVDANPGSRYEVETLPK